MNIEHIKRILLGENIYQKNLITCEDKTNHDKLIIAAFINNPYNLFNAPEPVVRLNDPNNDPHDLHSNQQLLVDGSNLNHDIEFLISQSDDYTNSYQTYVHSKTIQNFAKLRENKQVTWNAIIVNDNNGFVVIDA